MTDERMRAEAQAALEARRSVRAQHRDLFNAAASILYRIDPVGINFGDNEDEYEPEAGTILPRILGAADEAAAITIVEEEFARWFGDTQASGDALRQAGIELFALVSKVPRGRPA